MLSAYACLGGIVSMRLGGVWAMADVADPKLLQIAEQYYYYYEDNVIIRVS